MTHPILTSKMLTVGCARLLPLGLALSLLLLPASRASAQQKFNASSAADVRAAWKDVESWLKNSPYYADWMGRLRKNDLMRQLDSPQQADLSVLNALNERYAADANLLNYPDFENVRSALRRFIEDSTPVDWKSLAEQARAAIPKPRAVDRAELDSSRQQLDAAVAGVEARLATAETNEVWRDYLQLGLVKKIEAGDGKLDAVAVDEVCKRLWSARAAWPCDEVRSLQQAFNRYAENLRVFGDSGYADLHRQGLELLSTLLTEYGQSPTEDKWRRIAKLVGWFERRGDVELLVKAMQPLLLRPNLRLQLSARALSDDLNRDLDETFRVNNEVYLNTPVSGSGTLKGRVTATPREFDGLGAVELNLMAATQVTTTGSNSGVVVTSTSRANIAAEKIIVVEQTGLLDLPATADARARVDFDSISTPGGIYGRHALREVYGSRPRAESDTESSSALSARTHLDADAKKPVANANDAFRRDIIYPLTGCNAWPRMIATSANSKHVKVEVVQAAWNEAGPATPPPDAPADADAVLQVHATMLERTATARLHGRHFTGEEFASLLEPISSSIVPADGTKNDAEHEESPWSLTFTDDRPISVELERGQLQIALRLGKFESDGAEYPGVEVHVAYDVDLANGEARFKRNQSIATYPLGFVPGSGSHLSGPQQVMRKILNRRLARNFATEYRLRSFFPEGRFTRLRVSAAQAGEGWLLVAMTTRDAASDGKRTASASP